VGGVLGVRHPVVRRSERAIDDGLRAYMNHGEIMQARADTCRVWESNPHVLADSGV
jgi:hypothetical protein